MQSLTAEHCPAITSIDEIKTLVNNEFQAVDLLILSHLHSEVPLIQQISEHIVKSGGKRLRPLVVLLVAKAFGYHGEDHISLAAVIEFIHTATLLHDDVVDNSSLRRGQKTANTIWGNAASVLVGDFLYSRTFQILTQLKNVNVMELLAATTNAIAEGEVLQLVNRNNPDTSESHYMKIIRNKTAKLFEAAAEIAAVLCHRSFLEQKTMANYGLHLGTAFQLIDDVLDYSGDADELGKNMGDDLAEGKPTLPLIHAMQHASQEKSQIIRQAIQNGGLDNLDVIMNTIREHRSLEYTFNMAKEQSSMAQAVLAHVPDSPYRDALNALADFAVIRSF
jgi:octaprenyl-diphosphate synthase